GRPASGGSPFGRSRRRGAAQPGLSTGAARARFLLDIRGAPAAVWRRPVQPVARRHQPAAAALRPFRPFVPPAANLGHSAPSATSLPRAYPCQSLCSRLDGGRLDNFDRPTIPGGAVAGADVFAFACKFRARNAPASASVL